eukprot:scaffold309912_cov31-Tisochrysis_lutea.AAC.3
MAHHHVHVGVRTVKTSHGPHAEGEAGCGAEMGGGAQSGTAVQPIARDARGNGANGAGKVKKGCDRAGCGGAKVRSLGRLREKVREPEHEAVPCTLRQGVSSSGGGNAGDRKGRCGRCIRFGLSFLFLADAGCRTISREYSPEDDRPYGNEGAGDEEGRAPSVRSKRFRSHVVGKHSTKVLARAPDANGRATNL